MEKVVKLGVEKETKGTFRFKEEAVEGEELFGTVYVKKAALGDMKPKKMTLSVVIE
jgi:hypothetical protein